MDIPDIPESLKKLAEKASAKKPESTKWIQVHQEKGNFFRVVHADGVWVSMNPAQQIHLVFYSERSPIPTSVFFPLDETGTVLGEDVEKREVKKDWFREIDVDVVMSLDVAKNVLDGLSKFIQIGEDLKKGIPAPPLIT